jgi:hypothetical protein
LKERKPPSGIILICKIVTSNFSVPFLLQKTITFNQVTLDLLHLNIRWLFKKTVQERTFVKFLENSTWTGK